MVFVTEAINTSVLRSVDLSLFLEVVSIVIKYRVSVRKSGYHNAGDIHSFLF